MLENTLWRKASEIRIQAASSIAGGFDIGFDAKIPEGTKAELRAFIGWVESHFNLPVTLWVDFEYKHYLLDRNKKRAGYLFYWADFGTYPVFDNVEDIPIIRLPVRTERSTMEEILASFIEAISCYFSWLCHMISDDFMCDEDEVEEILQAYLSFRSCGKE